MHSSQRLLVAVLAAAVVSCTAQPTFCALSRTSTALTNFIPSISLSTSGTSITITARVSHQQSSTQATTSSPNYLAGVKITMPCSILSTPDFLVIPASLNTGPATNSMSDQQGYGFTISTALQSPSPNCNVLSITKTVSGAQFFSDGCAPYRGLTAGKFNYSAEATLERKQFTSVTFSSGTRINSGFRVVQDKYYVQVQYNQNVVSSPLAASATVKLTADIPVSPNVAPAVTSVTWGSLNSNSKRSVTVKFDVFINYPFQLVAPSSTYNSGAISISVTTGCSSGPSYATSGDLCVQEVVLTKEISDCDSPDIATTFEIPNTALQYSCAVETATCALAAAPVSFSSSPVAQVTVNSDEICATFSEMYAGATGPAAVSVVRGLRGSTTDEWSSVGESLVWTSGANNFDRLFLEFTTTNDPSLDQFTEFSGVALSGQITIGTAPPIQLANIDFQEISPSNNGLVGCGLQAQTYKGCLSIAVPSLAEGNKRYQVSLVIDASFDLMYVSQPNKRMGKRQVTRRAAATFDVLPSEALESHQTGLNLRIGYIVAALAFSAVAVTVAMRRRLSTPSGLN